MNGSLGAFFATNFFFFVAFVDTKLPFIMNERKVCWNQIRNKLILSAFSSSLRVLMGFNIFIRCYDRFFAAVFAWKKF